MQILRWILTYLSGAIAGLVWTSVIMLSYRFRNINKIIIAPIGAILSISFVMFVSWASSGPMDPFADPETRKQIVDCAAAAGLSVPVWIVVISLYLKWKERQMEKIRQASAEWSRPKKPPDHMRLVPRIPKDDDTPKV